MKKGFLGILVVIVVFQFSGCASTGFLMDRPNTAMFGNTYPAKGQDAAIDVYATTTPAIKI